MAKRTRKPKSERKPRERKPKVVKARIAKPRAAKATLGSAKSLKLVEIRAEEKNRYVTFEFEGGAVVRLLPITLGMKIADIRYVRDVTTEWLREQIAS